MGIGAFNLVRRPAYERIGTMRALSLRPDDDIRLGRRLRGFGFRQRVLNGNELLSVEWYASLGAAISGLEKSMYSSMAEMRALCRRWMPSASNSARYVLSCSSQQKRW